MKLRATVQSIEALQSLQIVHNAQIIAVRDLRRATPDPLVDADLELVLMPQRSGWIASRVLYRAPDGLLRQAHTSPIYVSVDHKPTASVDDARYMLRWIDRLVEVAESQPDRFPDTDVQSAVLATYAKARARYEQIIEVARRHWGD